MPTNLFILIFAPPLNYARDRYASLYFEFESYAQIAKTGIARLR